MTDYRAPLEDMRFLLHSVFNLPEQWAAMPALNEMSGDLADAILEEGAKLCEQVLAPLNRSGDEEGCTWSAEGVTTPSGFKEAYQTLAESGWVGLGGVTEYGGQGAPKGLTVLFEEMQYSANSSLTLYNVLTAGACLSLASHGSDELKETYLPPMYEGRWSGSMCLTEPHAGTDLGMIRSKAEPQADGSYSVTGTKIFITGGEHDLTENIIHLVLAKLPDAPDGPKGISLFVVPKLLVNADGSLGDRNSVTCGSIEHKMGIKGSATCVMNFDGATGYLVGEANKGLNYMFTMMNYERLSIGLQGTGQAEWSYQQALAYAKDRVQSKAADASLRTEGRADPIIVHPDVRRMLMIQKAYIEAGRALGVYLGAQLDAARYHPDDAVRAKADGRVALLTPLGKAFFTDRGLECTVLAQQVFGGHGYVREWGMEQAVRDVRIAQIYEGTNGIQAMDLIGRKVLMNKGEWLADFFADIRTELADVDAAWHTQRTQVFDVMTKLESQVQTWVNAGEPNLAGTQAYNVLELLGLITYGYLWLRMVNAEGADASKAPTAQFYFAWLWPQVDTLLQRLTADSSVLMDIGL
ncbi:MAG: acyl-CoA dehydrogenase family protein [Natronospirillum sp.]